MTWEIVVGIFALVSFIITIISFSTKINKTVVENTCAINELKASIDYLGRGTEKNSASIEHCKEDISDLKTEITLLGERVNTIMQ